MKKFKSFREDNQTCKTGEYYCYTDSKCKPIPSGYKISKDGMLVQEDAPVNNVGGGNIAGVGVGPAGEPGIMPKKKKKKNIVMGLLKRNVQENNDNNNVMLKQVLDGIDKVEMAIDKVNEASSPAQQAAIAISMKKAGKKPKSFKEKYKIK